MALSRRKFMGSVAAVVAVGVTGNMFVNAEEPGAVQADAQETDFAQIANGSSVKTDFSSTFVVIEAASPDEVYESNFADTYEQTYGQSVNGSNIYDLSLDPVPAPKNVPDTQPVPTTTEKPNAPTPAPVEKYSESILGEQVLTGKQLADWFNSYTKQPYSLDGIISVEELANLFIEEGKAEGVRGDIAFAQSILESGWFSYPSFGQVKRTDNNYAGIGAFNGTPNGFKFDSPRLGVRAQIQLLKSYADPNSKAADLANPTVRGDKRFDEFFLKGKAPKWTDLNGKWAVPGDTYGQNFLDIYYKASRHAFKALEGQSQSR